MPEHVAVPVIGRREVEAHRGDCLIVDVRTPAEFREVHIPGSINVPLADLGRFASELKARAAGKEMILICRTGKRATAAYEYLLGEGLAAGRVLEGGISGWVEAGLAVARGRKAMSIERQVRIVAGALVAIGSALTAVVSPWFLLMPGGVGMGLVVAGLTDTCAMGLLLARLPWNRAPLALTCPAAPSTTASEEATQ
jgi:rhodanese-related sulfurtransferase